MLTADFSAIKARQQQTWASGDYHIIAAMIAPIAERLCDDIGLLPGQRVLDVATGSGNAAIAAARRLCIVTGVDYVPQLLGRARVRAAAEGVTATCEERDVESLGSWNQSFDVVLSTFGVMFAPDQPRAAGELMRVCRPGGRIGLANWTPEGWIGQMLKTVGRHVPPPAGLLPTTRWGSEDGIRELLADGTTSIVTKRHTFTWRFASARQYLELFRTYYGPTVNAFDALDTAGRTALADDLLDTFSRFAIAEDGTMRVPAEYLEVVARTRA